MATARRNEVVVWEWFDNKRWMPYLSHVSNYIEQQYKSNSNMALSPCIVLANIDSSFSSYTVDVAQLMQKNIYTGFCRSVRRMVYQSPSPLADGILWQWEAESGIWQPYNSDIAQQLEVSYSGQKDSVTLNDAQLPYQINFKHMTQTNQKTGFVRRICRIMLHTHYVANSGPTATCDIQNASVSSYFSEVGSVTQRKHSLPEASKTNLLDTITTRVKSPEDKDCPICYEKMTSPSGYDSQDSTVLQLSKCKHQYHRACLLEMHQAGAQNGSFQCPVCKCIYGTKIGNCPPGRISVQTITTPLPGYPDCGTIVISYDISGGIQGPEHPNPGQPFSAHGFPRTGYLPDNSKGQKVCHLLQEAWKRRLTFTIGTSATSGEEDTVIWNEIHHKTSMENHSEHGYPDPNYLDNVLKELESQGVVEY